MYVRLGGVVIFAREAIHDVAQAVEDDIGLVQHGHRLQQLERVQIPHLTVAHASVSEPAHRRAA